MTLCFLTKKNTTADTTRMKPEGRFAPQDEYGLGEYCLILAFCPFLQALLSASVWRFTPFYEHYFSDRFGDSSLSTSITFRTHSEPFLISPVPTSTTFQSFPRAGLAKCMSVFPSDARTDAHILEDIQEVGTPNQRLKTLSTVVNALILGPLQKC